MASNRIRGQEATLRIMVDGALQGGSFIKVENFKITPKADLPDSDFLGEKESEPDVQVHGYNFSFTCHEEDSVLTDLYLEIARREPAAIWKRTPHDQRGSATSPTRRRKAGSDTSTTSPGRASLAHPAK